MCWTVGQGFSYDLDVQVFRPDVFCVSHYFLLRRWEDGEASKAEYRVGHQYASREREKEEGKLKTVEEVLGHHVFRNPDSWQRDTGFEPGTARHVCFIADEGPLARDQGVSGEARQRRAAKTRCKQRECGSRPECDPSFDVLAISVAS